MTASVTVEEIRTRLRALGLKPELVDLAWLAQVKVDVEERITAAHLEEGFRDAEPLFSAANECHGS